MTRRNTFLAVAIYLSACLPLGALAADSPAMSVAPGSGSNEQLIKQALNEKTTLDFQNVPLNDALAFIADKYHLSFQLDSSALKAANIDPAVAQVTMSVKDVSLRSALNLLLAQYDLAYVIKNEVLLFTTKAKADSMFETHLYDVRDLVQHEYDPSGSPDFDTLVDAIRTSVNPQSWDKAGGDGALATFSDNGICALVVWQNYAGHEQLENLLQELRRFKPQRALNQ